MQRSIALIVIAISAGCLAGVGPAPGSGQTTPPAAAAWTDGDGLNTSALARVHFATLREAGSFTVNKSDRVRVDGEVRPEGPRPEGYYPPSVVHRQVDLDADRYRDRHATADERLSAHFVSPDVTAFKRRDCPDCAVEFGYQRRPESDTMTERIHRYRTERVVERLNRTLRGVTVGFEYTHTGIVERDGERLHRYRAERNLSAAPPPFTEPPVGTATVLVTDGGVVRQFRLEYAGVARVTEGGESRTVDVTQTFVWRYTALGETTVERPDWVDRAAEADPPRTTETGSG